MSAFGRRTLKQHLVSYSIVTSQPIIIRFYRATLCYRGISCPSVRRLSQAVIASKPLNETSWVLVSGLFSTYNSRCCNEIRLSPKIRVLPCGNLSLPLDSENAATANRRQQNSSIPFTSICCESVLQLVPTVVQQLTRCRLTQRVARSLGGSRASCTWKHDSKLFKRRFKRRLRLDVRKFVFSNRVMNFWNSLPTQCVNCNYF